MIGSIPDLQEGVVVDTLNDSPFILHPEFFDTEAQKTELRRLCRTSHVLSENRRTFLKVRTLASQNYLRVVGLVADCGVGLVDTEPQPLEVEIPTEIRIVVEVEEELIGIQHDVGDFIHRTDPPPSRP